MAWCGLYVVVGCFLVVLVWFVLFFCGLYWFSLVVGCCGRARWEPRQVCCVFLARSDRCVVSSTPDAMGAQQVLCQHRPVCNKFRVCRRLCVGPDWSVGSGPGDARPVCSVFLACTNGCVVTRCDFCVTEFWSDAIGV